MSVGSPHHAPRTSTAWHSSRLCATRALLSIHNQHHAPWFGTLVVCVVLELTRRHFYSPHARPLLPLLPATSFVSVVCPYVSVRVRTCPYVSLPCPYDVRGPYQTIQPSYLMARSLWSSLSTDPASSSSVESALRCRRLHTEGAQS